jgi:hypothetical protein
VLGWLDGPSDLQKKGKQRTYRKKYVQFCVNTKVQPFPLSIDQLLRFTAWLPENDIDGGWDSARNYIGAAVKLCSFTDPRQDNSSLWEQLRVAYNREVQVVRKNARKLAIRAAHLEALCLQAISDGTNSAIAAAACDTTMFFSAVRVGHVAPKSSQRLQRVIKWEEVLFYPSVDNCEYVFFHVPTTKTRQGNVLKPWFTAYGRVVDNPSICPVRWMVKHLKANYAGDSSAPLFAGARGPVLTRHAFTKQLRARLVRAVDTHLNVDHFDIRHYSGISFRKGGITALSVAAAIHQVADFADHQSVETSRKGYIQDAVQARAGYTTLIAQSFSSLDDILRA